MNVLELKHISKDYPVGDHVLSVLHDVTFSVDSGDFVAIMGPSGSGKSTLLNILGLLDKPTSGSYYFRDADIMQLPPPALVPLRRKNIGFIFQSFQLLPRLNALQNVELPLMYAGGEHRRERAQEVLHKVGLAERMHHYPRQLSGGEQQRVAIARALVNDPTLLLADEPTGNLDSISGQGIINLFSELHRQGRSILMVTHDQSLANRAEHILHIHDGVLRS